MTLQNNLFFFLEVEELPSICILVLQPLTQVSVNYLIPIVDVLCIR